MEHVKAGKLRALAVAAPQRLPSLPNVPTFGEAGMPGFMGGTWFGLFLPAKTPKDIAERIHAESVAVLRAPADGHTLLFSNNATNGAIEQLQPKSTTFRTMRDFAPVSMFGISPSLMVVRATLGVKDAKEFVALAKSKPGKVTYASSAIGSAPHLASELFQAATGTKMLHVPYSGAAPIISALLGDTVDMYIGGASTVMGQVRAGKLRVLGAVHPTRMRSAPDVPTLGEQGISGVEYASWFGMLAPAQVPAAILDQLNADSRKVLESADGKAQLDKLGVEYMSMTRSQFHAFLTAEVERTAKIVNDQKLAQE